MTNEQKQRLEALVEALVELEGDQQLEELIVDAMEGVSIESVVKQLLKYY